MIVKTRIQKRIVVISENDRCSLVKSKMIAVIKSLYNSTYDCSDGSNSDCVSKMGKAHAYLQRTSYEKASKNKYKWEDHVQLFDNTERVSEVQKVQSVILKVEDMSSIIKKVEMKTRELVIWEERVLYISYLNTKKGHALLTAKNTSMLEEGCHGSTSR